jgi:hypothetical protein
MTNRSQPCFPVVCVGWGGGGGGGRYRRNIMANMSEPSAAVCVWLMPHNGSFDKTHTLN